MRIKFIKRAYPLVLLLTLGVTFISQIMHLAGGRILTSIVQLMIALFVFVSLFFVEYESIRYIVKGWSLIILTGGLLGSISVLLYLIVGSLHKIDVVLLISHLVHIIIGYYLFTCFEYSVNKR